MNNKYTTSDIADHLSKTCNLPIPMSDNFFQEYLEIITEGLLEDGYVDIDGLGTFRVVEVEKQQIANLENGTVQEIPKHKKVIFVAQEEIAAAVNEPFGMFEPLILEDEKIKIEPIEEAAQLYFEEREPDNVPLPIDIELSDEPIKGSLLQPELGDSEENLDKFANDFISHLKASKDEMIAQETFKQEDGKTMDVEQKPQEVKATIEDLPDDQIQEETIETPTEEIDKTEDIEKHTDTVDNNEQSLNIEGIVVSETPPTKSANDREVKSNDMIVALIIMTLVFVTTLALMWFSGMLDNLISKDDAPQEIVTNVDEQYSEISLSTTLSNSETTKSDSVYETYAQVNQSTIAAEPLKNTNTIVKTETTPIYETISKGVMLTSLAKKHYGNKFFWCYIYEENRSKIKNPNLIPLGTKLTIAPREKYGIDPTNRESVEKAKALCNKLSK
ncbi:MAG: HU family DNA-binding protein [Bacteroidales bacterium]